MEENNTVTSASRHSRIIVLIASNAAKFTCCYTKPSTSLRCSLLSFPWENDILMRLKCDLKSHVESGAQAPSLVSKAVPNPSLRHW
jgi:hypothetical protein